MFLEGKESKLKWQLILEINMWQLEILIITAIIKRSGSSVEKAEKWRKKGSGSGLTLYQNQASGKGKQWNLLMLAPFVKLEFTFLTTSGFDYY